LKTALFSLLWYNQCMSNNHDDWYDSLPKNELGLVEAETNPEGVPDQSQTLPERERGGAKWSTHTPPKPRFAKGAKSKKRRNMGIGFSVGFVGIMVIGAMFLPTSIFGSVLSAVEKYGDPTSATLARHYNSGVQAKLASGTCTSGNCRWQQFSQKELQRLEQAGAKTFAGDVEVKSGGNGKVSIDRIEVDGKVLTATNYERELANNAALRETMRGVYNPKYESQAGRAWQKMRGWYQLSKAKNLKGNSADEVVKALDNVVEKRAAKIASLDDAASREVKAAVAEANPTAIQRVGQTAVEAVKAEQVVDTMCGAYNSARAANLGAKTVRKAWMIPTVFAMLNLLYAIKDGEEVSMQDTEAAGKFFADFDTNGASAMNSYGGNYAVYGDAGPLTESASLFTLGGQGPFSGFTAGIAATLAYVGITNVKGTCGFIRNPITQFANAVGGGLLMFFTSGATKVASVVSKSAAMNYLKTSIASFAKNAIRNPRVWAGVAIESAFVLMPIYLQNVLGGQKPSELSHENNGDMFFGGAESLYADIGKSNYLAPLSIDQAIEQDRQTVAYRTQVAEEERATHSPFDITSEYTLFGSIVHALAPKFAALTSGWSVLNNLGMILQLGFVNTVNQVSAASDPALKYSICDDDDYLAAGFACTPFGNLAFGLPDFKGYEETRNYMMSNGHISGDGSAVSDAYKTFTKNCPDRPQGKPYGWEDEGDPFDTDGSECLLNSTNTYFYNWGIYAAQEASLAT
jgi:hypothetical protein